MKEKCDGRYCALVINHETNARRDNKEIEIEYSDWAQKS